MSLVNIQGIDRVELLRALWQSQKPASFFNSMPALQLQFNEQMAKQAITGYIDYFCGRCIKNDLTRDMIEPSMYDQYAGNGAFQQVVDSLKASKVLKA